MFARPGDSLKGQYRKLAGLARRPDAIIVYCGHNELSDGIPWSHKVVHYVDEQPSIFRRIDELAGQLSPACRLIRETADRFRSAVIPPPGLFHPLVDSPSYTPADYTARLAGFRRRLEALASYCERIGALAILVVPPANDAGFEPSRSFLPAQTTRAARGVHSRIPGRSQCGKIQSGAGGSALPVAPGIAAGVCRDALSPGLPAGKRALGRGVRAIRQGARSRRPADALRDRVPGRLSRSGGKA